MTEITLKWCAELRALAESASSQWSEPSRVLMEYLAAVNPTAISRLTEKVERLTKERDQWRDACRSAGVCMTCATRAPEPYGCTDCLNTGWVEGAPSEARVKELEAALRESNRLLGDVPALKKNPRAAEAIRANRAALARGEAGPASEAPGGRDAAVAHYGPFTPISLSESTTPKLTGDERDLLHYLVTGRDTRANGERLVWGSWTGAVLESLLGKRLVETVAATDTRATMYFATDAGRHALREG